MIIEHDYFNHWKTLTLCDLLSDHNAGIYPIRLWTYLLTRKTDVLTEATPRKIAAICQFRNPDRTPESFVSALIESELFDYSDQEKTLTAKGLKEVHSKSFSAWENGRKRGSKSKKSVNPKETQEADSVSPNETESNNSVNPKKTQEADSVNPNRTGKVRLGKVSNNTPIIPLSGDVRKVLSLTCKTEVRENRQLTRAEARAWDRIKARADLSDEIALLARFYGETKTPQHDETWGRKMAALALMNNWEAQLDLASAFYAAGKSRADRQTPTGDNFSGGWRG